MGSHNIGLLGQLGGPKQGQVSSPTEVILASLFCSTHISSTESSLALSLVPVGSTQWQELYEESYKEQEARVPIPWIVAWWKQLCTKLVQAGQRCLEAF